jgi:centromeric protein E
MEFEDAKNTEIEEVRQKAAVALTKALEEAKLRAAKVAENTRKNNEQKTQELQAARKKTASELEVVIGRENTLQSKVKDLQLRLASVSDEKEAILAVAKDGEETSKNLVEESLSKQRESYEKMLKDQSERHENEAKSLHDKVSQVESKSSSLQEAAATLESEFKDSMATLLADKDKLNEELGASKTQLDDLTKSSAELDGAEKRLKEENNEMTEEIQKLRSSLEERDASYAQKAADAGSESSKMKAQLDEADKSIATLKEQHDASLKELHGAKEASVPLEKLHQLEEEISLTNRQLADERAAYDEQMTELMNKMTSVQRHNAELDNQLKQWNELESKHRDALAQAQNEHAATRSKLEAEVAGQSEQLEARVKTELESQSKKHAQEISQMKSKMAEHVDKMNGQLTTKLTEERQNSKAERDAMVAKDAKSEEKFIKLVSQLKALTEAVKKGQEEKNALQSSLNAEVATKEKLAKKVETQKQLVDETTSRSESAEETFRDNLKSATSALKTELQKTKLERDTKSNHVEELTGKLGALSTNLNSMAEDVKTKEEAVAQAKKQKVKLDSSETEMENMRREMNKLKLELTKTTQLANRLQNEKEASEQNHGQRTAMMGMLENQLAEVNEKNAEANANLEAALYDLSQKDESLTTLEQDLKDAQAALALAEKEKKESSESILQAQKGASKRSTMMTESLQRELQQLQQSTARKSAAAQKLIQEREAECAELRAQSKRLLQEVDKGSLSDRKIFELAEMQSNRESAQSTEIEVRDRTLERLKTVLLNRDGDLAAAENMIQEVEQQVEELCRIKRREDVNMDYLKSIVVQFLSKPPGTSERSALLPVLATLLQVRNPTCWLIQSKCFCLF